MAASRKTVSFLKLNKGAGTSIWMDKGNILRVAEGNVAISEAPEWLGEQLVQWEHTYRKGATYVAAKRGHVRISAYDSEIVIEHGFFDEITKTTSLFKKMKTAVSRVFLGKRKQSLMVHRE